MNNAQTLRYRRSVTSRSLLLCFIVISKRKVRTREAGSIILFKKMCWHHHNSTSINLSLILSCCLSISLYYSPNSLSHYLLAPLLFLVLSLIHHTHTHTPILHPLFLLSLFYIFLILSPIYLSHFSFPSYRLSPPFL